MVLHYESVPHHPWTSVSVPQIHQKSTLQNLIYAITETLTITYLKGCDNLCTTSNKFQWPAKAVSPSLQPRQLPKHACQKFGLPAGDDEPILLKEIPFQSAYMKAEEFQKIR